MTLNDVADITLAPFLAQEQRAETAREQAHRLDLNYSSGVRMSAMQPEPFRARSDEEIRADAERAAHRAAIFDQSPRGRFIKALKRLDDLGFQYEAHRARSAYYRGFADDQRPADVGEIACALIALNDLDDDRAREARMALNELLLATSRKAA